MYKNMIKNKLQKLGSRALDLPALPPETSQQPIKQLERVRSSRRSKLSLSKDLSIASNSSTDHNDGLKKEDSLTSSKKAYIRVVSSSAQKDLLGLSSSKICLTAHGVNSERLQNHPNRHRIKGNMFQDQGNRNKNPSRGNSTFDAIGLKDMAMNLAKSAAILNEKIVPILLQAATLSHKRPHSREISEDQLVSMFLGSTIDLDRKQNEDSLMQTPINHLKHRIFQEKDGEVAVRKNQVLRCETDPDNNSLKKYKNRHKIQHSPAPVKKAKSPRASFCTPTHAKKQSQTLNQQEETNAELETDCKIETIMHPLGRKLEMINCERKLVECRIAKKLDELSNKATSIVKQYSVNETELAQSHSKIPKVLLSSNKSKAGIKVSSSRKQNCNIVQQRNANPSSKEQNLRNMIMNRIFS